MAEIGEVVLGVAPGRGSPAEITLFRSLGLAVEDLAAVRHIYGKATETGGGTASTWWEDARKPTDPGYFRTR